MLALSAAVNYTALWWSLGVICAIILIGLILWPIFYMIASQQVYLQTLRRGGKNDWDRGHPSLPDANIETMYDVGMEWSRQNAGCKKDVQIVSGGLKLYGEYYDFGYDRCAIILTGRTENMEGGYYFAMPYPAAKCNVLVIDPRAHGLSEGKFNTVGFEESGDALAWAAYAHDELGVKSIIFHGVCIGSAAALYALTSDNCPDYVKGMVADGMFANFSESVKEHLIERKKPVVGLLGMINFWMKHYTGHSMKFGPIDVIDKLDKPILMLHSKEDIYSRPVLAQKLFDKAQSEKKQLVWFEHGRHSMLRITDTQKYDGTIAQFVKENF